jgi:3-keto-disaccharide hydrolase
MSTRPVRPARLLLAALLLGTASAAVAQQPPNTLTAAERSAGWRLLFDGQSFAGWRGLGATGIPAEHWKIVDGAIEKVAAKNVSKQANGRPVAGGDLMTEETFGDFELAWEWRVTPGANSGLKYNVSEALSTGQPETVLRPATGTPGASHSAIGFEYQMIDDDHHPDGRLVKHKTGDLYDLISSNERKHVKPVGEWNESRVVFRGNHGEHWLNGEKVVDYELGTPAMAAAVAASKFKMPWFAERRRGHIVLQDHNDEVYFRSIRIRPLDRATDGARR